MPFQVAICRERMLGAPQNQDLIPQAYQGRGNILVSQSHTRVTAVLCGLEQHSDALVSAVCSGLAIFHFDSQIHLA